jgi:hypothetical protein
MPMSQRQILDRRWKEATFHQPELKQLLRLLLKFGGGFVVAPAYPDPDLAAILTGGFVQAGAVVVKKGRVSRCHENIAGIWRQRRHGIVGIGTGYALSDDGLWRQHSWGVLREGVLETTVERTKYFGLVLQGDRARVFAVQEDL